MLTLIGEDTLGVFAAGMIVIIGGAQRRQIHSAAIGRETVFAVIQNRQALFLIPQRLPHQAGIFAAVRIPLDRIVEWNNNDREDNKLNFRLDNNQVFSVVCCETSKADNYLNQVLPDNNTWDLRRDMIREKSRHADANFKKKVKGLFNGKK